MYPVEYCWRMLEICKVGGSRTTNAMPLSAFLLPLFADYGNQMQFQSLQYRYLYNVECSMYSYRCLQVLYRCRRLLGVGGILKQALSYCDRARVRYCSDGWRLNVLCSPSYHGMRNHCSAPWKEIFAVSVWRFHFLWLQHHRPSDHKHI